MLHLYCEHFTLFSLSCIQFLAHLTYSAHLNRSHFWTSQRKPLQKSIILLYLRMDQSVPENLKRSLQRCSFQNIHLLHIFEMNYLACPSTGVALGLHEFSHCWVASGTASSVNLCQIQCADNSAVATTNTSSSKKVLICHLLFIKRFANGQFCLMLTPLREINMQQRLHTFHRSYTVHFQQ